MKKKPKKEIDIKNIVINAIVQLFIGIIIAIFTTWYNKTFGFGFNVLN